MMKRILMFCLLSFAFGFALNSKTTGNKHVVKKGETLYSLAKKYGVSVSVLAKTNHISTRTEIKIGQHLVIPGISKLQTRSFKPVPVPSTPDTPYREEDVRQKVVFASTENSVPVLEAKPAAEKPKTVVLPKSPVAEGLKTSSSNATEYPDIFNEYAVTGYFMKKNKGTANYILDATSGNQNLAFYNDAETGSVIRVTNLMNHKTIFVKVIGKVPSLDAKEEVMVKLSNKAARDLEVTDEKFLVEVASFYQE